MADFAEHFQVKPGTLLQPLGFDEFALADKLFHAVRQFHFDGFHRRQNPVPRGDVVAAGIDGEARNFLPDTPGQWVK